MADLIIAQTGDADCADFALPVIKSNLTELRRLGLITPAVFSRCLRYLDKHPEEFAPLALGPLSCSDAVDLLLQVAA